MVEKRQSVVTLLQGVSCSQEEFGVYSTSFKPRMLHEAQYPPNTSTDIANGSPTALLIDVARFHGLLWFPSSYPILYCGRVLWPITFQGCREMIGHSRTFPIASNSYYDTAECWDWVLCFLVWSCLIEMIWLIAQNLIWETSNEDALYNFCWLYTGVSRGIPLAATVECHNVNRNAM